MTGTIQFSIYAAIALSFVGSLLAHLRWGIDLRTRQAAFWFGFGWVALLLLEHFILGPNSFIYWDDEGEYFIPIANYLNEFHLGGKFVHGIAGGLDRDAMAASGGEKISLLVILMRFLPTWLAILIVKGTASGLAYAGSYLLCRRGCRLDRTNSAFLSALFTVGHFEFVDRSSWTGVGLSFMPMVAVLSALGKDKHRYWFGVCVLGVLSASLPPTHFLPAVLTTIVVSAFILKRVSFGTIIPPAISVIIFSLANWHEGIVALKQMAPLTVRGLAAYRSDSSFINLLSTALGGLVNNGIFTYGMTAAAAALIALKNKFAFRVLSAALLPFVFFMALKIFPWDSVGLIGIRGITSNYMFLSIGVVMLVSWAHVLINLNTIMARSNAPVAVVRLPQAIVLSLGVALLVQFKGDHARNILFAGGQAQYHKIGNLKESSWKPAAPFRVATLRLHSPEPNIPSGFYGLDAIDGSANLPPRQLSTFWGRGVFGDKSPGWSFIYLSFDYKYFWCCDQQYDIGAQVDLDMLRIANVGHIISPAPMRGKVHLVSGPDKPPLFLLDTPDKKTAYLKERLSYIFSPTNVYVYSIGTPLPRVFAAKELLFFPPDIDDDKFLAEIKTHALDRIAVVRGRPPHLPDAAINALSVLDFKLVKDGFDVSVEAPLGGVIVANVSALPFWRAYADGQSIPTFSANMIHLAATVPPGARKVIFRYERPNLGQILEKLRHPNR